MTAVAAPPALDITIPKGELLSILESAARAVSGRTSITVLQNILIEADESTIKATGCNGEQWITASAAGFVVTPGKCLAESALLLASIKTAPDGDVTLRMDGKSLTLGSGKWKANVSCLDWEDFPACPPFESEQTLTLPFGVVRRALARVLPCVSTDRHREALTGVFFDLKEDALCLVATNTHILAKAVIGAPAGEHKSRILPTLFCESIIGLKLEDTAELTLGFRQGQVSASDGSTSITSAIISGTFPAYERVIPPDGDKSFLCATDELAASVARCMPLARQNASKVRLTGQADSIKVSASTDGKNAEDECPAVTANADGFVIHLNAAYLSLFLKHGESIRMSMTTLSRPVLLTDPDDPTFTGCVMPMAAN